MRIAELWRFPVKSLQGEQVDAGEVTTRGLRGDRAYAIFDAETGFGLTARRAPEMLFATARLADDEAVEVTLPDGSLAETDADLSAWLGRPVELRASADAGPRRYENPDDLETESADSWHPFDGAPGAFHDSASANVSLVSLPNLGGEHPRRFRANVVLDSPGDDELVGQAVALGGARLDVGMRIPRCVMVTRPQPGGLERDREVLRRIHRERGGLLAVGGTVSAPGTVRVGDEVAPAVG
jgi:uncharacterized protein YcbX